LQIKRLKEVSQINNFVCFDLEGPLALEDNAYELMKLFPGGGRIFKIISRYDDILTMEKRGEYEPGDTLALIVPFLVLHNISIDDIDRLATESHFTVGAEGLVSWLQWNGWKVFCITTAYEPYALHITNKLGIFAHNVACTSFPGDRLKRALASEDVSVLKKIEEDILSMDPADDEKIEKKLDDFFWEKLPATGIGEVIKEVKPVGGGRKKEALKKFADKHAQALSGWVAIGDSITDSNMLKAVDVAGGLAVAFNGNNFALPFATMSLASTDIGELQGVFKAWQKGGRRDTEKYVRAKENAYGDNRRGYFNWLSGKKDLNEIIDIHRKIRYQVREEAGKLG